MKHVNTLVCLLALPLAAQTPDSLSPGDRALRKVLQKQYLLLREADSLSLSESSDLLEDAGMVRIDPFSIDVYEYPNQLGALPMVNVTWEEAQALCQARGKRLCTEAEWDRACRGPQDYLYGYGPQFEPGRCNTPFPGEGGIWQRGRGPAPAGQFAGCATPSGIHDLIGNVWEWTDDWYDRQQGWRVVRGGAWFNNVNLARADARYGRFLSPAYRLDLIGFRCCR